jgi:hypothetical protein
MSSSTKIFEVDEYAHGLPHLLHQKEGWFPMPRLGLSSLKCPDDQELIPSSPHFRASQPTSRCEVLHEA